MKRRTHRHSHRRVSRPAVFKQQVKRKEARKLAKYPLKTVYVSRTRLYQPQNRGASDVIELYDDTGRRYFYRDTDGFCPVKFSPMLAKK